MSSHASDCASMRSHYITVTLTQRGRERRNAVKTHVPLRWKSVSRGLTECRHGGPCIGSVSPRIYQSTIHSPRPSVSPFEHLVDIVTPSVPVPLLCCTCQPESLRDPNQMRRAYNRLAQNHISNSSVTNLLPSGEASRGLPRCHFGLDRIPLCLPLTQHIDSHVESTHFFNLLSKGKEGGAKVRLLFFVEPTSERGDGCRERWSEGAHVECVWCVCIGIRQALGR
jgi:hypothetical protein